MPRFSRVIQTLLGVEYRPQFYINIYNRLRNLEFSDKDQTPISVLQKEYVQNAFYKNQKLVISESKLLGQNNKNDSDNDSDEVSLGDFLESEMAT